MPQNNQVRQIRVVVDTKGAQGLKELSKQFGDMGKNTKNLAGNVSALKNVFLGYLSSLGVGRLAEMSDTIQLLRDRINVLAGSTEAGTKAFNGLLAVAGRTKSSVESVATIYSRLAASTKNAIVNSDQLLTVTEALANSFRLSGSTAAEATGASVQLAQGLASGAVRGQELRSVLEQNVVLADLLAKEFADGNKGLLFKKAEDNLIGANRVIQLLLDSSRALRTDADKLGQTFGQSVTIALDQVSVKVEKLNRDLGLTEKFAKAIGFAVDNLGAIMAGIAASAAAGLLAKFVALAGNGGILAGLVALLGGPVTAAIVAVGVATAVVVSYWEDISEFSKEFRKDQEKIQAYTAKQNGPLTLVKELSNDQIQKNMESMRTTIKEIGSSLPQNGFNVVNVIDQASNFRQTGAFYDDLVSALEKKKRLEADELARQKLLAQEEVKRRGIYYGLNQEFKKTGDIKKYTDTINSVKMKDLSEDFRLGKISLEKFRLEAGELKRDELGQAFANGKISAGEFNRLVAESKIEDLNTKLKFGTITLKEYNEEFSKLTDKLNYGGAFQTGLQAYSDSIGTSTSMLAESIKNTFSTLEDEIFKATKSGQFNFESFTQAILDDLTKIAIRALIIKPIVDGLLGSFGVNAQAAAPASGGTGYLGVNYNSKGGAFSNGVKMFAHGGIVDTPTIFGYGPGKVGMAGEAGSEAILPLRRGADGNLGVVAQGAGGNVQVNIINQSGGEVETREKTGPGGERIVEVLIQKTVRDSISGGVFDKAMAASFGVKRQGA